MSITNAFSFTYKHQYNIPIYDPMPIKMAA